MAKYAYRALNKEGKEIFGIIQADSQALAINDVRSLGLYPTQVREARKSDERRARKEKKGDFEYSAVCDVWEARLKNAQDITKAEKAYRDYREILRRADIDGVVGALLTTKGEPRKQLQPVPGYADACDDLALLQSMRAQQQAPLERRFLGDVGLEGEGAPVLGQVAGAVSSASVFSISSRRSKGSRVSRSILLMKVTIGISRRRQTSNNLRVRASIPLAASITITAESTAVSVR